MAPAVAWSLRGGLPRALPLIGGALAGLLSLPWVVAAVVGVGLTVGLDPGPPRAAAADAKLLPLLWAAGVAPWLEEGLYRAWLLPALARPLGPLPALLLSSAAFAWPHLARGPWDGLATLLVGILLGGVFLASGSLGACVGLHAGLNAAALLRGVP